MIVFDNTLGDFFLHGGIFTDLIKDGTKSVLAGGVLATLNILFKERREAQRLKLVEAYTALVQVRDRALIEGSKTVGVVPLDYISERIRSFEQLSSLKAISQSRPLFAQTDAKSVLPHSRMDTVFAIVLPAFPVILSALLRIVFLMTNSGIALAAISMAIVTVYVLVYVLVLRRIRSWTVRSLENAFVRHASQLIIGLAIDIIAMFFIVATA